MFVLFNRSSVVRTLHRALRGHNVVVTLARSAGNDDRVERLSITPSSIPAFIVGYTPCLPSVRVMRTEDLTV